MLLCRREHRRIMTMLRHYTLRVQKLEGLRAEYSRVLESGSVHAQDYTAIPAGKGRHSDPVSSRFTRLEALKARIAEYEKLTDPVRKVYNRLKNSKSEHARQMFAVLDNHEIGRQRMPDLSAELDIPERTLYRRHYELCCLVYQESIVSSRRKWS